MSKNKTQAQIDKMTRESSKILLTRNALLAGEASGRTILDGDATLTIIDEIYDYFELLEEQLKLEEEITSTQSRLIKSA